MLMMILTAAEAAVARQGGDPNYLLEPVPLRDGSYALPLRVLDAPEHAAHHALLASLPQREVDAWEIAE
jgi:hypothetical protein